jgi:hypothetical protein
MIFSSFNSGVVASVGKGTSKKTSIEVARLSLEDDTVPPSLI